MGITLANDAVQSRVLTGQVIIASAAVQLTTFSQILQNGLIIKSKGTNNTIGGTIGLSTVTNVVDGTGNGMIIEPGSSTSIPSGVNINLFYVHGQTGDIFSYQGS